MLFRLSIYYDRLGANAGSWYKLNSIGFAFFSDPVRQLANIGIYCDDQSLICSQRGRFALKSLVKCQPGDGSYSCRNNLLKDWQNVGMRQKRNQPVAIRCFLATSDLKRQPFPNLRT